jgi:anti-anti-sigma factor
MKAKNVLFDFSRTTFIDSTGLGFLVNVRGELNRGGKQLLFAGIQSQLKHFFELNRTWDLFKERTYENVGKALVYLEKTGSISPFYYMIDNGIGHRVLKLFGRLDAAQISGVDIKSIIEEIGTNDCIVDLDNLGFVDSSGLVLFFKIKKYLASIEKRCILCSLNDSVHQVFRITRLDRFFAITRDFQSARHSFEVVG